MLINDPKHLNQNGSRINKAAFLEISVFGQGALVPPLREGSLGIFYFLKVQNVFWTWQPCNFL